MTNRDYQIRRPVELVWGTRSAEWLQRAPTGKPVSERDLVLQATQARLDARRLALGIETRLGWERAA